MATPDALRVRETARQYTAAWCSQDPARVAAFFAPNGSLEVNDGAPAVGREAIAGVARGSRPEHIRCVEDGIQLEVEPKDGQKTGMYVDQRENRIRVGTLSRGARVLDCYSYQGGFALQAARGGALSVTAVDSSITS